LEIRISAESVVVSAIKIFLIIKKKPRLAVCHGPSQFSPSATCFLFKHPRKKEQRTSTTILISCVEITFREMSVPAIHAVNAFLIKSSALVQKPHMRETETETETVFCLPREKENSILG